MSDTSKLSTCQTVCWGLAGITGLMTIVASSSSLGIVGALVVGIAVAGVLGVGFRWLVCTDYPSHDRGIGRQDIVGAVRNVTGITGYKAPPEQAGVMDVAMGKTAPAAKAPKAAPPDRAAVKADTVLEGEQELAGRKGEWRYDATGDESPDRKTANVDTTIGTRPAGLSAPKGGQADDLKQVKGVGPKLEQLCNDFGFYHFEQIAAWGPDEVAWVDENLVGFKGRVSRDNWVEQAKTLAAGGNTKA